MRAATATRSGEPEHLWSLREDVSVIEQLGGDVIVGGVRLPAPGPVVRDALHRMMLGPVLLSNVAGARDADPESLIRALNCLHPLVVRSLGAGDARGPLLSVTPLGTRRFVVADVRADALLVSRPGNHPEFRVEVHRDETGAVLAEVAHGAYLREVTAASTLAEPLAVAVLGYLQGAGLVDVADVAGRATDGEHFPTPPNISGQSGHNP